MTAELIAPPQHQALPADEPTDRAAEPLPTDDPGFLLLVRETHPELEYIRQRHRAEGETTHVWRHSRAGEYVVLVTRDSGPASVREHGAPWYDRLSRLAGMWEATSVPGGDR